jgi:tetratricopeptide (TPR) repeat protein
MRDANTTASSSESINLQARRAQRRLFLASWLPVMAAVFLGTIATFQVSAEQEKLVGLKADLSATQERAREAEQARRDAETRKEELSVDVTSLQQKVDDLQSRESRLRQAVDLSDPQVAIAKVRTELGGRTPAERADSYWRRGQDAVTQKQLDLAEKLFLEAIREDPKFAPAINGLGLVAAERGQLNVAEKFYLRAVDADPKYKYGLYNLAHLYFLKKKYGKATEYANRTLEIDPNYGEASVLLAKLKKLAP